jgi:DNA-binding IclR family transcriptional regulator
VWLFCEHRGKLLPSATLMSQIGRRPATCGRLEIAARIAVPKPTVSRLTYTLTELGFPVGRRSENMSSRQAYLALSIEAT